MMFVRATTLILTVVVLGGWTNDSQSVFAQESVSTSFDIDKALLLRMIRPAINGHIDHNDLATDRWTPGHMMEAGRRLFVAKFTKADGLGRPAATGSRFPVPRRSKQTEVRFTRGQGPDANSCASCHHQPFIGGGGDFTANVFKELGAREQPNESINREFSNERGTTAINGAGALELLAREMTTELHRLREHAAMIAKRTAKPHRQPLVAKGISFGYLTAMPPNRDNDSDSIEFDLDEIEGIDHDLIVRPFSVKATTTSLREFTIDAMNLHHGMQATERYGVALSGSSDFDEDGIADELTQGDITAVTLYQAMLPIPGRVLPDAPDARERIRHGESLFTQVGCAECHRPKFILNDPVFSEPSPFNFIGNLQPAAGVRTVEVNLATDGESPRIERSKSGGWIVRAFTDFKRHKISDARRPYFQNEIVEERFVPTDVFRTTPLWGCGNTAPYGHRGDLVTLIEVIEHHGGEANQSRAAFDQLSEQDQNSLIDFLNSLQILPAGSKNLMHLPSPDPLPYATSP